jgi:hypothetical protein
MRNLVRSAGICFAGFCNAELRRGHCKHPLPVIEYLDEVLGLEDVVVVLILRRFNTTKGGHPAIGRVQPLGTALNRT